MKEFANKPGTKIAVWIVSALLAAFFVFVGGTKALMAWEVLEAASMGIPVILLKTAGFAELFGAAGLILPALTRIAPVLTPIAAAGLVLTMIGATGVEIALGHPVTAVQAGVAGLLSAFVAVVRFAGLRATTAQRVPTIGNRTGVSAGAA